MTPELSNPIASRTAQRRYAAVVVAAAALGLLPACDLDVAADPLSVAHAPIAVDPEEPVLQTTTASIHPTDQPDRCVNLASTSDLAVARLAPCSHAPTQRFTVSAMKPPPGDSLVLQAGDVVTLRAAHSGKCLDVNAGSTVSGAPVIQWTCHDGANQKWVLIDAGDGAFQLKASHSGLCLSRSLPNMALGQDVCDAAPDRVWSFQAERPYVARLTNDLYQSVPGADGNDGCLAVDAGTTADGARIWVDPCSGAAHESFRVEGLDGSWGPPANGREVRLVAQHSGKCLDVAGASTQNGAPVVQWSCAGVKHQTFRLEVVDGSYRLVAKHSGLPLTMSGWKQLPPKTRGYVYQMSAQPPGRSDLWNIESAE